MTPVGKSIYRNENLIFLKLLKQCRSEAGLTQEAFAESLGRPQSFVSDMERGLRRLDLIQLRDVCQALGVSLGTFVQRFEDALAAAGDGHGEAAD